MARNENYQDKTPPSKVSLYVAKVLREKKQFQHGTSTERLQEDYLESYKMAMPWNVFIFQHFNDGMVSSHFI